MFIVDNGLLVIPVFYKVGPSDVKHQKGSYGEALTKQQKWFKDKEKLQKWKMALRQVADLSGYHFKDGYTALPIFLLHNFVANFDSLCFLENVREKSDKHGIEYLQSILISQVLTKEDINLTSKQTRNFNNKVLELKGK